MATPKKPTPGSYRADLQSQLQAARQLHEAALGARDTASHALLKARQELEKIEATASPHHASEREREAQLALSQAEGSLREAARDLQDHAGEVQRLTDLVDAPARLAEAQQTLRDQRKQHAERCQALTRAEEIAQKLNAHILALREDIDADLRAAADAMAASGDLVPTPDSALRQRADLQAAELALEASLQRADALRTEVTALAEQVREAHASVTVRRVTVAEVALREAIHEHIGLFARAAAARESAGFGGPADRFVVEIPPPALEAAREALWAEQGE